MKKYAVLTFDEPEFEPSYINTPNEGKGGFCRLFFTGKYRLSDVSCKVYRHRSFLKASVYILFQIYYSLKSKVFNTETIFDFLGKYNIKGTFFGVFELIDDDKHQDEYLDVFKKIVHEGHELGLHGYKHRPLTLNDLNHSIQLAKNKLGLDLRTYSSPWGDDQQLTVKLLQEYKFKGFRVWSMKEDMENDLVQLKYRNDLNGCTMNEDYIILNIHGPDMYPLGKSKIIKNIRKLLDNDYEFITFEKLCEIKK